MKGLTIDQFKEVVEFVQKYHNFARWVTDEERQKELEIYPSLVEYGFNIKYIDSCYDSRGQDIWSVGFRSMGNNIVFRTNYYTIFEEKSGLKPVEYNNLYDWIMSYLKGEWVPNECTLKFINS